MPVTAQKIRWGIMGCARIAELQVIPALLRTPNASLNAVASRNADKLEHFKTLFGSFTTHLSYEELITNSEVDAIYIPLPNSMHCEWAIRAMEAGKHVLCEKPLALNAKEAQKMIDTAKKAGVLLMEAFMYRYTKRMQEVEKVLKSGVLGQIKSINSSFRFFLDRVNTIKENPELGGGAIYDVGCYPLNFAGFISKASPISIEVECEKSKGVDVNTSVLMRYESGLIANLHCGFNAFGRIYSEIIGSEGALFVPDTFLDEAGDIILQTSKEIKTISVAKSDRYSEEIQDFSAAVIEKRAPMLCLDESLQNMQIMDKILKKISIK